MIAAAPTTPVVAVFGRNRAATEELDAARSLGTAIARAGAVLLTGGTGTGAAEIKEQAVEGAVAEGGAWIGVENADRQAPPRRVRGGLVVSPGVGHRRNFLGACLCDLAVVLPGEDGTASELLFALALGRPMMLVGQSPQDERTIHEQARRRVPPVERPRAVLDRAIAAAYRAVPRSAPVPAPLDTSADDLVRSLLTHRTTPLDPGTVAGLRKPQDWDDVIRRRAAVLDLD